MLLEKHVDKFDETQIHSFENAEEIDYKGIFKDAYSHEDIEPTERDIISFYGTLYTGIPIRIINLYIENVPNVFYDYWDITQVYIPSIEIRLNNRLIGHYFYQYNRLSATDWGHNPQTTKVANLVLDALVGIIKEPIKIEEPEDDEPVIEVDYKPVLRKIIPVKMLTAIYTFYALEYIARKLDNYPPTQRYDRLRFELSELKEKYNSAFARALRDYLLLASCGEARHAKEKCEYYSPLFPRSERQTVFSYITKYDKDYLIRILKGLFYEDWEGGYGGQAWLSIIEAIEMYKTVPDMVFIDHCIDLEHNNGLCFDKGIIFNLDKEAVMYLLDRKREAEDLHKISCLPYFSFIEKYNNNLLEKERLPLDYDLGYTYKGFPAIEWGDLKPKGKAILPSNSDEDIIDYSNQAVKVSVERPKNDEEED